MPLAAEAQGVRCTTHFDPWRDHLSRIVSLPERTARATLLFGVIFWVIRELRHRQDVPLVALLSVAVFAGVLQELLRLRRVPAKSITVRRQAIAIGVIGAICWFLGMWVDQRSSDSTAWVLGSTIGVAIAIAALELWASMRATRKAGQR